MKTPTTPKRGLLTPQQFIEFACKSGNITTAYLTIRSKVPVKYEQIKQLFIIYNN